MLRRVEKADLGSEFSYLGKYFDTFVEKYPEWDKWKMIEDLVEGNSVMWASPKCFVIGRPNYHHNTTMFLIEAAGGESHEDWVDDIKVIEDEVKAWGFDQIEFHGRLGWKKVMSQYGYRPAKLVMRKKI